VGLSANHKRCVILDRSSGQYFCWAEFTINEISRIEKPVLESADQNLPLMKSSGNDRSQISVRERGILALWVVAGRCGALWGVVGRCVALWGVVGAL
jgi:hypothetical protein